MSEHWEARGPDGFGDFTISEKGEQLAKCVVVQNGFRSPAETKAIAERLIKAVNSHDALVQALEDLLSDVERQMKNPSHHQPFSYQKAKNLLSLVGEQGRE